MVRIALAGTGGMADYQAKKFSKITGCTLSVCKDHKPELGMEFAAKHGMARCFDDIETLLDSGLCDALSCAVVDGRHRGICEPAMARGFPVLCEKPLARTLADCEAMASSACASGVPNIINFSKRNAPALSLLRDVVKSGILGSMEHVEAEYLQGWVVSNVWGNWQKVPRWRWRMIPGTSTAGVVGDLGSHLVDALLYVFGDLHDPQPISSRNLSEVSTANYPNPGILPAEFCEEPGPVCVEFSGCVKISGIMSANIHASWIDSACLDSFKISIRASKFDVFLDLESSRDSIELHDKKTGKTGTMQGTGVVSLYEHFVAIAASWLQDKKKSYPLDDIPDFHHGLRVQQILNSLYEGGIPS